jgi:hypothetical protein
VTYPVTVDIPEPNKGLGEWLLSEDCRSPCLQVAELMQALYREDVAKRTGRLAASAHASTEIGGHRHDRHIGVLTVGGLGAGETVFYALAHEFGVGKHPGSREGEPVQPAADDLQRVLEMVIAGAGSF